MEDATDEVEEKLSGEDRGRSGVIIVRRDLDKVNADHGSAAHEPGAKLKDLALERAERSPARRRQAARVRTA